MYILEILEFLFKYSDNTKHITVSEIYEYLKRKGLKPQKKTIRANLLRIIEYFNGGDFTVEVMEKDGHYEYWIDERIINLYDGINIANAVCMNNSLEMNYKKDVVNKISLCIGKINEEQFYKTINMKYFEKEDNRYVSYIPEVLSDAINDGKKVRFEYNVDPKDKNYIRTRTVSPYKIIQKKSFYYLLANCDSHDSPVSYFRIDRILNPVEIDENINKINVNINEYLDYPSISLGQPVTLNLSVHKDKISYVYDRYGYDVNQYNLDNDRIKVIAEDKISDEFFGWLFMLGTNADITYPEFLKNEYNERLKKCLNQLK